MEWLPVESDMLTAVRFSDGRLQLKYRGGKTYTHLNVPEGIFTDLLAAESKGKFVNKYIKTKYPVKP